MSQDSKPMASSAKTTGQKAKPTTESSSASLAAEVIMQQQGQKNPVLAAKQARLLQILKNGMNTGVPPDSSASTTSTPPTAPQPSPEKPKLPDAPTRGQFSTQDEYEEALGGWTSRVGRIKGAQGLKIGLFQFFDPFGPGAIEVPPGK